MRSKQLFSTIYLFTEIKMFASDLNIPNFRNSKNFFRKYFLKTFKMENLTMEVRQMMSKVVCGSTNWQKMCRVRCQCYVGWRCLVEKLQSSQQPATVPLPTIYIPRSGCQQLLAIIPRRFH